MWYTAVGRVIAVIEAKSSLNRINQQVDVAVERGDIEEVVRLLEGVLSGALFSSWLV